jgi:hypothetical protein
MDTDQTCAPKMHVTTKIYFYKHAGGGQLGLAAAAGLFEIFKIRNF